MTPGKRALRVPATRSEFQRKAWRYYLSLPCPLSNHLEVAPADVRRLRRTRGAGSKPDRRVKVSQGTKRAISGALSPSERAMRSAATATCDCCCGLDEQRHQPTLFHAQGSLPNRQVDARAGGGQRPQRRLTQPYSASSTGRRRGLPAPPEDVMSPGRALLR